VYKWNFGDTKNVNTRYERMTKQGVTKVDKKFDKSRIEDYTIVKTVSLGCVFLGRVYS